MFTLPSQRGNKAGNDINPNCQILFHPSAVKQETLKISIMSDILKSLPENLTRKLVISNISTAPREVATKLGKRLEEETIASISVKLGDDVVKGSRWLFQGNLGDPILTGLQSMVAG